MKQYHLWVIGGDPRHAALAQALAGDGHTVHTYALELAPGQTGAETGGPAGQGGLAALASPGLAGVEEAHCVILPLPAADGDNVNAPLSAHPLPLVRVVEALRPGQLLCAGRVGPPLAALAQGRGVRLVDYLQREELAIANAVPTSEGAIQLAMEELPITLHGARCLIVGGGRLGKVLVRQLQGLGARVSLAARSCADLAWAQVWGCGVERSTALAGRLGRYDLIVNTVPAPLLGREELSGLQPGCLVLDLASKPGGVDFQAAAALGVKAIWALSLPGKAAPLTAALAIKSTIYNILTELGV